MYVQSVIKKAPRVPDKDLAAVKGLFDIATSGLFNPPSTRSVAEMAAADADIELRGKPRFDPEDSLVRDYIVESGGAGAALKVHYGDLARGVMVIRYENRNYQSSLFWMPLNHPQLFSRGGEQIGLVVNVLDGVTHAKIMAGHDVDAVDPSPDVIYEEALYPVLFGRSYHGKDSLEILGWHNDLLGGMLHLATGFILKPPDGPDIVGAFVLQDNSVSFSADTEVVGSGFESTKLPITRHASGLLTSRQPIEFSQDWKLRGFDGKLSASYVDGSFEARALVNIKFPKDNPRLTGQINVIATSLERAWAAARSNSPSPLVMPGFEASGDRKFALAGWGTLSLELTKGFSVTAAFLLDPDGYLTVRGTLRTPRQFTLLDAWHWPVPEALKKHWSITLTRIPLFLGARVNVTASVSLIPGATIGPLVLRDILVEGLYSTRPGVGSQLDIAASFLASAEASLTARAELKGSGNVGIGKVDLYFWEPDLSVDVVSIDLAIEGKGSIIAYAEARPRIKIEGGGDPATKEPTYRIGGHLEAAGAMVLDLSVVGGFDLLGLISKSFSIGVTKYEIAGGAISVDIDHVIGEGKDPEIKFTTGAFNPDKFVEDLRSGDTPEKTSREVHGSFRDPVTGEVTKIKTTKHADLPALQKPDFELEVPFAIKHKPHELFLVFGPPPRLQVSSGPRKFLSDNLRAAKEKVDESLGWQGDEEIIAFMNQQLTDLDILIAAALALEKDAKELGPDVSQISPAELPGLSELATQLAEYGERYGDAELVGFNRLAREPIQQTEVAPVQIVLPGAVGPYIGGFTLTTVNPLLLDPGPLKAAKSRPGIWERNVAMRYVTEQFDPILNQNGLVRSTQTDIVHPGNPKEYKRPEAVYTNPNLSDAAQTEIVLVEATLNPAFFTTNRRGTRSATGDHKIDQIPRTLNIAAARWPNARIRYVIICNVAPGEKTANWLRSEVINVRSGFDPNKVSIEWLVIPLAQRPPTGDPGPTADEPEP